ncbi:MAG: CFI-box-CTERM domain-containing protein, partial [Syntrophomonadaceae bacterium]
QTRQTVISRILAIEPDYKPPTIKTCFVATATLGDIDHPYCIILRTFRDNILAEHIGGRLFIKVYYQHGPKLARVIERNEILRGLSLTLIVKPWVYIACRCLKKLFVEINEQVEQYYGDGCLDIEMNKC